MRRELSSIQLSEGFGLYPSVLSPLQLGDFSTAVEGRYRLLEQARRNGHPADFTQLVPPGQKFSPTASSVTLGAVLSEQQIEKLLAALYGGLAGEWLRNQLGACLACDLDQAWVRRQYAPARYPALHAPHGWHQDGALGFDFLSHAEGRYPPDALLKMATCWIPLERCGTDAPGLELLISTLERLLSPQELIDQPLRARFSSHQFWRPLLDPGDALLFSGGILHRTYVTQCMTRDRTSIELRFFPAESLPSRLDGDRFLVLNQAKLPI